MTVVKVVEIVGSSTKGWQEAAEAALKETSKTVRNIVGMNVVGWTAKVEESKTVSYRADVKIAFVVERP